MICVENMKEIGNLSNKRNQQIQTKEQVSHNTFTPVAEDLKEKAMDQKQKRWQDKSLHSQYSAHAKQAAIDKPHNHQCSRRIKN